MTRKLKSVSQFANESVFTEGQLRWFIFQSATNGLQKSGALVRCGSRRVYIDTDRFDDWLTAQQPKVDAA
jgi:hypothetical protein